MARAVDRYDVDVASPQSPFTPIADYAFLSNCHTGALVARQRSTGSVCR
jgi:hypothetical protein